VERTGLSISIGRLQEEIALMFQATGFSELMALENHNGSQDFNFNHPKMMPAGVTNRNFGQLAAGEDQLRSKFGLTTGDFTEMDPWLKDSYLAEIYDQIRDWHQQNHHFAQGNPARMHCTVLANGTGYHMHIDQHTVCRYHIALRTNAYSYMLTQIGTDIKAVHIPADGEIWLLHTGSMHTAINLAPGRLDPLQRLRSHIIVSVC
jgi:hypothetical protein